jgi:hypothetical protein
MAITALGIKNAIQQKLDSLNDEGVYSSLSVHTAWADGIREYLTSNLKIGGLYVGVTNANPLVTDTLGGEYVWDITSFELTGETLQSQIQGLTTTGFDVWIMEIESAIQSIEFAGVDNTDKVTTESLTPLEDFVFSIAKADLMQAESVGDIMVILAQKLYDSIMDIDVSEQVVVAESTTPGTGTVTYTELS